MVNVANWLEEKFTWLDWFNLFAAHHSYSESSDKIFLISLFQLLATIFMVYFKSELTVFSWIPNTRGLLVEGVGIFLSQAKFSKWVGFNTQLVRKFLNKYSICYTWKCVVYENCKLFKKHNQVYFSSSNILT